MTIKIQPAVACSLTATDTIEATVPHFSALELSVDFAMDTVDDALLDHVAALREQHNLTYSVHAPFRDINIASLNEAVFNAAKADTLRALEVAVRIGARLLNLHPGVHGYFPQRHYADMKARERDVITALCDIGAQHNILIAVENLIETNVHFEDTWDLSGTMELVRQVNSPVLGLCLDTGHAFQAGLDVAAAVRTLAGVRAGRGLIHLHAHDNHGGPIDEHLPVGDGAIDWLAVYAALDEVDFDGMLVFENYGLENQQKAWNRWQQIAGA